MIDLEQKTIKLCEFSNICSSGDYGSLDECTTYYRDCPQFKRYKHDNPRFQKQNYKRIYNTKESKETV